MQFEVGQLVYWAVLAGEPTIGIVKRVNVGMADYEVYWFSLERALGGYRAVELIPAYPQEAQNEV